MSVKDGAGPKATVKASVLLSLLLVVLFLAGCAGAPDVRPGAATEYMTEEEEKRFGYFVDAEVTNLFLVAGRRQITEAVAQIGSDLAGVSHRPKLGFSFKVLNSSQINAFAGPGGYVYVTTGLLEVLESRDELAAVLAHELGHVSGRHSVRALRSANIAGTVLTIFDIIVALGAAAAGVPAAGDLVRATGFLTTMIIFQGYSRAYEAQADRLGIQYMKKAGYQPKAMISVFEKFIKLREEEGKKERLTILSSHPALEERIQQVKDYIARLDRGEVADEQQKD